MNTNNVLLKNAIIIGNECISNFIESNNVITWPMLDLVDYTYNHRYFDILKGNLGNYLFIADLYRASKIQKYKDFVNENIRHLIDRVNRKEIEIHEYYEAINLGYTIYSIGNIFADEKLSLSGMKIILDNKKLRKSTINDIYWGNGREIILLLCIYKKTKNSALKSLINDYIKNIEDAIDSNSIGSYMKMDKIKVAPLLGFAHGSSGLAWVLSELYNTFGIKHYRNIIYNIFRYEDFWFNVHNHPNNFVINKNDSWVDRRSDSWCDLRFIKKPEGDPYKTLLAEYNNDQLTKYNEVLLSHPIAFCNGNSGIISARMRSLELLKDENNLKTMQAILDKAMHMDVSAEKNIYSMCCGLGGTIETYLQAFKVYGETKYFNFCIKIAKECISNYAKSNDWKCYHSGSNNDEEKHEELERFRYTYFKGIVGVGYSFLRILNMSESLFLFMPTLHQVPEGEKRDKPAVNKASEFISRNTINKYWKYTIKKYNTLYAADVISSYLMKYGQENVNCVTHFSDYISNLINNVDSEAHKHMLNEIHNIEKHMVEFELNNPVMINRCYEHYLFSVNTELDYNSTILKIQNDVKIFKALLNRETFVFYINSQNTPSIVKISALRKRILDCILTDSTTKMINNILAIKYKNKYCEEVVVKEIIDMIHDNIIHKIPAGN